MLTGHLDHFRTVIVEICSGLPAEVVTRPDEVTGYSLLGLVKHLTLAEDTWFEQRGAARPIGFDWSPEDPDSDFRIEPGETPEKIIEGYRAACARSRAVVDELGFDGELRDPAYAGYTIRWVVMHMGTETARHCGHADIIRERLDGRIGVGYDHYGS